jgi:outer membrane protein TolC
MHRRLVLILLFSCITFIAHNQSHNLDFYIQEGLHNSPLLNELRNQFSSSHSDSLLIDAGRKPLVEVKSQLLYSPFYNNFGYDEVITDGGNYMGVVGVSQNIFNKRELNNKYNAIDLQKKLANNSSRVTASELKKLITEQYLIALSVIKDYQFNKTFLELLVKENEIVKQFVKSGVYKQTDYLQLLVETQSQEIQTTQLKSQCKQDLSTLNRLCGLTDTSSYNLEEPILTVKGEADISKLPSYIKFNIDSLRIENEKAAIDIRYQPKVNWFADAGFLTSNPWNFYKHFGYSVGIGLNIPIYDGSQKSIEREKLKFEENSRSGYKDNFRNQYFQQIQQLKEEINSLNETSVQLRRQLATSDELVKALKDQLEAGIIQMTEYITALKNSKSIGRNLNLVSIQKLQVTNEINFLLTQ